MVAAMNILTLKTCMALRGLSQSDISRLCGISRQAVSHWFRSSQTTGTQSRISVPVKATILLALSKGLELSADKLMAGLPNPEDDAGSYQLKARLLWDRLYPSLSDLAIAIAKGEKPALARLAEALGMFEAAKIAGPQIWRKF